MRKERDKERVDEWDTRKNESETVQCGKIEIKKGIEKGEKEKEREKRDTVLKVEIADEI